MKLSSPQEGEQIQDGVVEAAVALFEHFR